MSIRKNYSLKYNNQQSQNNVILSPIDKNLLVIIIFLTIFGLMAVFSAGAPVGLKTYDNPAYYALKHVLFLSLGFILMYISSVFDYKKLKNIAVPFALAVLFLLILVKFSSFGRESNGATRWLTFLPIQPSEFAKPAAIILIAAALVDAKEILSEKMLGTIAIIAGMLGLIFIQPNLSMTVIIALTTAAMLWVGGVSFKLLLSTAAVGLFAISGKLYSHQLERLATWRNPWIDPQGGGYNLIQSWYAIASGGLFGVGFGNSKQKLFWLPERHTDFIFSIIAEEFGFIGCLIVLGLFVALLHRGFFIANTCNDRFGRLLAFGITFSIGVQAFINIGVTTGILPVTGITLPLISYGGSSIIVTMAMLGILLNISRKRIRKINSYD
ncbi:MAG: putative lipid II flippase FtsW [Candidatus Gastranaerophilales bacterium]|nr:putative lipid II flippase FtsW [Candidatus Gastranaerophilales bacterium]